MLLFNSFHLQSRLIPHLPYILLHPLLIILILFLHPLYLLLILLNYFFFI